MKVVGVIVFIQTLKIKYHLQMHLKEHDKKHKSEHRVHRNNMILRHEFVIEQDRKHKCDKCNMAYVKRHHLLVCEMVTNYVSFEMIFYNNTVQKHQHLHTARGKYY
jgi:hypothetical protein